MNYSRTLKGAALAAALLLGQTQPAMAQEYNHHDGVIFCKVTLHRAPGDVDGDNVFFSVTIPATSGAIDALGNPATIWNLGDVQCGGVYDTFYNGGPGYFRVKNTGTMPAYTYVSTGTEFFRMDLESRGIYSEEYLEGTLYKLFGLNTYENFYNLNPTPTFRQSPRETENAKCYKLAVAADAMARVPSWRPLSRAWCYCDYHNRAEVVDLYDAVVDDYSVLFKTDSGEIGEFWLGMDTQAYLAYMPVGETQLFDLKFWAPMELEDDAISSTWWFIIRIEAAAFKLWDHEQ